MLMFISICKTFINNKCSVNNLINLYFEDVVIETAHIYKELSLKLEIEKICMFGVKNE